LTKAYFSCIFIPFLSFTGAPDRGPGYWEESPNTSATAMSRTRDVVNGDRVYVDRSLIGFL